MKAIILAAGKGKRMGSETDNKHKCMVEFKGKAIIDYTLETFKGCGIDNIIIVNGYKKDILETYLENKNIKYITNKDFDRTNMVYSLFCAEPLMNDDLIVSYSDIIFNNQILLKLIDDKNDFVVTVDKNWLELWKLRMEDPLSDAETLKITHDNFITDLGKTPNSYHEIQGQYIGLIKISKNIIKLIKEFYHSLDKKILYDGQTFDEMYMTSFIQLIIDNVLPVKANIINGGWLEFDTKNDLEVYTNKKITI